MDEYARDKMKDTLPNYQNKGVKAAWDHLQTQVQIGLGYRLARGFMARDRGGKEQLPFSLNFHWLSETVEKSAGFLSEHFRS